MRLTVASFSALAIVGTSFAASLAQAASVSAATAATTVDTYVPLVANAPLSFQTFPHARCVLSARGSQAKMTVYADDSGTVSLHFTPARGGARNGNVEARCDAHGAMMTKNIRVHVVAGGPRPLAVPLRGEARPLVPRGLDPAKLTEADLRRLELPPRPDAVRDPKNYADWLQAVTIPVRRIREVPIVRPDLTHGPVKLAGVRRALAPKGAKNGSYTSGNWSGIVDFGGTNQFTYWVAGKWTVPAVSTDIFHSVAYSSTWDGLDGWGSSDVVQNGTEQDAINFAFFGSFATYSAWYEFFPDGGSSTLPNFSVNPGDDIYAVSWICYDGNGNRDGCYYMENMTQGEATPVYSELGAQPALFQGNSAEWITERPTINNNVGSLPQFGLFPYWWEHVYDSYAGAGYNACDENENVISMTNGNDVLASGFTTSCDSSDFYWTNYL